MTKFSTFNLNKFTSVWAEDIVEYLKKRDKAGYNALAMCMKLIHLDRFCNEKGLNEKVFTPELADEYRLLRKGEAHGSRYNRINAAKKFFETMLLKGYMVTPPRNVSNKGGTTFIPHIYTEEETKAYFKAVDTYNYGMSGKCGIMMPVIFRILACCGTRLTETLAIRKCDIDLEKGIIKLQETKNGAERYVALNDDLLQLVRCYANRTFYNIGEKGYIFTIHNIDKKCTETTIHNYHVEFLHQAGIPYNGEHKGPRIHDWRWTAAVMSCKQLIDNGMDMHTSLVYLAQWLGHRSIESCEYYLKYVTTLFPYLCEKLDDTLEKALQSLNMEVLEDAD